MATMALTLDELMLVHAYRKSAIDWADQSPLLAEVARTVPVTEVDGLVRLIISKQEVAAA